LPWLLAVVIGLAAVVGLVVFFNARDDSGLEHPPEANLPGRAYTGAPVLSPALESAVKRGNVVVLYRDSQPPPGTQALVPPGGRALEQAGQAVILEREPTLTSPLAAVAATRIQHADRPPALQPFIDYWLGA
jgi:hypothetical protein